LAVAGQVCAAVLVVAAVGGGATRPAEPPSDAAIVLEIQRLMRPDLSRAAPPPQPSSGPSVEQPAGTPREALLANLRKIPALIELLEQAHPGTEYRALAYSLAVDALILRRQAADETVSAKQIAWAARRLLSVAADDELRVKARFILLEAAAMEVLAAARPRATTASASAWSPGAWKAKLTAIAARFVALADAFPRTTYAPAALYQAGGTYLQAGRQAPAVDALQRLGRDYPKDPFTLKALMVLVQLHTDRGEAEKALQAKRRVVACFGGSAAAVKYRADIARAECLGKPFFLRFRSVRDRQINVRDHGGKTVLVYFYARVAEPESTEDVVGTMRALASLAAREGCVLLAVGADRESDAGKVAAILDAHEIDTPNLLDPDAKVASNYGVLFVPTVAVIGPDGKLRAIISDENIPAAVGKALRAPASRPAT